MERQKCEVWSRVMGYHRPISGYNIGKKSEFLSRKYFNQETSLANELFIKEYETN